MIVSEPRALLWKFVNSRLGTPWSEDIQFVGLYKGDCLRAVAAYNAWVGKTCCFHGAIDDPTAIDRTYLQAIFEYPFDRAGVIYLLAPIGSSNKESKNFCVRSGFQESLRLPGAGLDDDDLVIYSMQRHDCKWLKGTNGEEIKAAASA